MKRSAFTMVELVFVIVILGILASIAVPRLAASRDDAVLAKGKADISAIRSSIDLKRSQNLLSGVPTFPDLNRTADLSRLFDGVLDYPIDNGASGWRAESNTRYTYRLENVDVVFEYDNRNGVFTCVDKNSDDTAKKLCNQLTQ
ncbi:MAG: type II secretion system GspH family protein [Campylobacteraceae bacterium]|jgi:general secretion pathway protein G|nr:type II secretion system GspH family protein [Campylobacteraceae bacterium]